MEIREIDAASQADINIKNEPFSLFGRLLPTFADGQWGYEIRLFSPEEVTEMCFPDENYDFDSMSKNHLFLGAYEDGKCVGLAILRESWHKYMYLHDLKVSGQYRKKGVGHALLEKAGEHAVARGYRGIYTIGQDDNLGACKFYLKEGFAIGGFDDHIYRGTGQEGKADVYFYLDI